MACTTTVSTAPVLTQMTACTQVSTLESSVQQISEQLEALKSQSDERGESMTDTGPLVRLKAAMKKMKDEIREMDLRLGTVSHNLLHVKMTQSTGELSCLHIQMKQSTVELELA